MCVCVCVCVCVFARVRSGARVVHPLQSPTCTPGHEQAVVGFKLARRLRRGATDRLQASQVGISHHGQGVRFELLVTVAVASVRARARPALVGRVFV